MNLQLHYYLGIQVVDEMKLPIYWSIYITITLSISGVSFICLNIKKMVERFKELKIQQSVTISIKIPDQENIIGQHDVKPKNERNFPKLLKINNSKHNDPMFSGIQMASIVSFSFCFVLSILYLTLYINPRKIFLYQTLILEPIMLKIVVPIVYLIFKNDVRSFMWKKIMPFYVKVSQVSPMVILDQ